MRNRKHQNSVPFAPFRHGELIQESSIQDEIYNFWALHAGQWGKHLLRMGRVIAILHIVLAILHVAFTGLQLTSVGLLIPQVLLFGSFFLCKQHLDRLIDRWPVIAGSGVQVLAHWTAVYVLVVYSLRLPDEVMRHRFFLTVWLPAFISALLFYMPSFVFISFVCPAYICSWFAFHLAIGFLPVTAIVFALSFVSVVIYGHHLQTTIMWNGFQAKEELVQERQRLQSMQESLLGILSSIFDASCVCDRHGQLLECSPHLQEILRCSPQLGMNLCSFTATEAEHARLEEFLLSTLANPCPRAAKLQCSFRGRHAVPLSSEGGGLIEACLYAIVLPATKSPTVESDTLFVVWQEQSTSADVQRHTSNVDSMTLLANSSDSSLPLEEGKGSDLIPGFSDAAGNDVHLLQAPCDDNLNPGPASCDALSVSHHVVEASSSQGACVVKANSHRHFVSAVEEIIEIESAHSSSLTYSATATQPSNAGPCAVDASMQTETYSIPQKTASTQTEPLPHSVTIASRLDAQPGHPPRPAMEVETKSRSNDHMSRSRISLKKARFGTPFITHFKGTPATIVEFLVSDSLRCVNPLVSGCCSWHAGLLYFQVVIQKMLSQACPTKFVPNQAWQCEFCLILLPEHYSECDMCGSQRGDTDTDAETRIDPPISDEFEPSDASTM